MRTLSRVKFRRFDFDFRVRKGAEEFSDSLFKFFFFYGKFFETKFYIYIYIYIYIFYGNFLERQNFI